MEMLSSPEASSPSLETLPLELRQIVLSNCADVSTLGVAIKSAPALLHAYLAAKRHILHQYLRKIPPELRRTSSDRHA